VGRAVLGSTSWNVFALINDRSASVQKRNVMTTAHLEDQVTAGVFDRAHCAEPGCRLPSLAEAGAEAWHASQSWRDASGNLASRRCRPGMQTPLLFVPGSRVSADCLGQHAEKREAAAAVERDLLILNGGRTRCTHLA
jgi:hypothetical protein